LMSGSRCCFLGGVTMRSLVLLICAILLAACGSQPAAMQELTMQQSNECYR